MRHELNTTHAHTQACKHTHTHSHMHTHTLTTSARSMATDTFSKTCVRTSSSRAGGFVNMTAFE